MHSQSLIQPIMFHQVLNAAKTCTECMLTEKWYLASTQTEVFKTVSLLKTCGLHFLTSSCIYNMQHTDKAEQKKIENDSKLTIKSSTFSIRFRGLSQLGSAFIFLRLFTLAHMCIQVTSLHKWKKQGINHKFFIGSYKKFVIDSLLLSLVEWSYLWQQVALQFSTNCFYLV